MGDKNRGRVFTKYLNKNFNLHNVLLVADGNLVTGRELYLYCKHLTVIDPDIRNRSHVRKYMQVVGKYFYSDSKLKCDLIIGMHPDEATGEIVDYAIKHRLPCVIVPCCVVGKYSHQCSGRGLRWCKFLKNILVQNNFDVVIDMLDISGSNLAIKAIPN